MDKTNEAHTIIEGNNIVEIAPQNTDPKLTIQRLSDKYKENFKNIASLEQELILEMSDMVQGNVQLNTRTGVNWNRLTPQERSEEINKLANERFTSHIAYLKRASQARLVEQREIEEILIIPTLEEDDRIEAEKLQSTLRTYCEKIDEERLVLEQKKEDELKRLRGMWTEYCDQQDSIAARPIEFAVQNVLAVAGSNNVAKEELLKKYREDPNKMQDFKKKVNIEILKREAVFEFTEGMKLIKDTYQKTEQDIAKIKEEFEQAKQKFEDFFAENNNAGTKLMLDQLLSKGSDFFTKVGNQIFSDSENLKLITAKETLNKFVVQNVDSISITPPGELIKLPLPNELQEYSSKLQDQQKQLRDTLAQLEKDRKEYFVQYQEKYKEWRLGLLKQDAEHKYDQNLIYKEALLKTREKELIDISNKFKEVQQAEKEEQEEHKKLVGQLKLDIDTAEPEIEKNLQVVNLVVKKLVKKDKVQEADKLLKSLEDRYKPLKYPDGEREFSSLCYDLSDRLKEVTTEIFSSSFLPDNTKLVISKSGPTMSSAEIIQEFPLSSETIKKVAELKERIEQLRADYNDLEQKINTASKEKPYSRYEYLRVIIPFSRLDTLRIRINTLSKSKIKGV